MRERTEADERVLRQTETVFDPGRRGGVRASGPPKTQDGAQPARRRSSAVFSAGSRCNRKPGAAPTEGRDTRAVRRIIIIVLWTQHGARARPAFAINTAFVGRLLETRSRQRAIVGASSFHFASRPLRPAAFHVQITKLHRSPRIVRLQYSITVVYGYIILYCKISLYTFLVQFFTQYIRYNIKQLFCRSRDMWSAATRLAATSPRPTAFVRNITKVYGIRRTTARRRYYYVPRTDGRGFPPGHVQRNIEDARVRAYIAVYGRRFSARRIPIRLSFVRPISRAVRRFRVARAFCLARISSSSPVRCPVAPLR